MASSNHSSIFSGDIIANTVSKFATELQSKFKKRDAVIEHHIILGHKLKTTALTGTTFCSQCGDLIFGVIVFQKSVLECTRCKLRCHTYCLTRIKSACLRSDPSSHHHGCQQQQGDQEKDLFTLKYFATPTFCKHHCGTLLKGVFGPQGYICDPSLGGCGRAVHHHCKALSGGQCCRSRGNIDLRKQEDLRTKTSCLMKQQDHHIVSIKDFELLRLLGQGSTSKVYLAQHKQMGQKKFAIKVIEKTNAIVCMDPESVMTEMKILQFGRKFPFLTVAHCSFQTDCRLFFVMEYVAGPSLLDLHLREKFTEDRTRFYAAEIVLALNYLHTSCNIVYRDLKLENVIIDREGHCKLLDFGLSKELRKAHGLKTRTFCGTPSYISPEVIKEQAYGFSVDWWALGVLTFEMLLGISPFEYENENVDRMYELIANEDKEVEIPLDYIRLTKEATSFLKGLLVKNPDERLGCKQSEGCEEAIFKHNFFRHKFSDQWEMLRLKKVRPPYIAPEYYSSNDDAATASPPMVIGQPVDPKHLKALPQDGFQNFSFCSSSFQSELL